VAKEVSSDVGSGDRPPDLELLVDVGDMPLDCANAQYQFCGDLLVASAGCNQTQHFSFARGQIGHSGIRAIRSLWRGFDPA
jgi:hypothetical protein